MCWGAREQSNCASVWGRLNYDVALTGRDADRPPTRSSRYLHHPHGLLIARRDHPQCLPRPAATKFAHPQRLWVTRFLMFRLMPGLTWTTHAHDDTGMRGREATQACQSLNERILAMKALGAVRQKKLVHIKYVTSIFPSTAMISRPAYYARVHIVCEILWYAYCTGNCSKTIFLQNYRK